LAYLPKYIALSRRADQGGLPQRHPNQTLCSVSAQPHISDISGFLMILGDEAEVQAIGLRTKVCVLVQQVGGG